MWDLRRQGVMEQHRTARPGRGAAKRPIAARDWATRGRCRDLPTASFFAEDHASSLAACSICGQCEVRPECLAYAMANCVSWGVWGGTTADERRQMRQSAKG